MVIYIWIGMFILAALQAPPLLRERQWRELAAFTVIWTGAGLYATLVTLQVAIPNPFEVIRIILEGVYRMVGINF